MSTINVKTVPKAENLENFDIIGEVNGDIQTLPYAQLSEQINNLQNQLNQMWKTIYPVGAIYISVNSTSPGTLFGGSWERIQDRFLLSAGSSYSAGSTGGSATHTLTASEMPSHTHTFTGTAQSHTHISCIYNQNNQNFNMATSGIRLSAASFGAQDWVDITKASNITTAGGEGGDPCGVTKATSITPKGTNSNTGSGSAHNNMPPYLSVYVWKRTA